MKEKNQAREMLLQFTSTHFPNTTPPKYTTYKCPLNLDPLFKFRSAVEYRGKIYEGSGTFETEVEACEASSALVLQMIKAQYNCAIKSGTPDGILDSYAPKILGSSTLSSESLAPGIVSYNAVLSDYAAKQKWPISWDKLFQSRTDGCVMQLSVNNQTFKSDKESSKKKAQESSAKSKDERAAREFEVILQSHGMKAEFEFKAAESFHICVLELKMDAKLCVFQSDPSTSKKLAKLNSKQKMLAKFKTTGLSGLYTE